MLPNNRNICPVSETSACFPKSCGSNSRGWYSQDGISRREHSAAPWQWNQKVTQFGTLTFTASASTGQSGITAIVFE